MSIKLFTRASSVCSHHFYQNLVPCCYCSVPKLCLSVCDPVDCSSPGFSVYRVLQTRIRSGLPFPSPESLSDAGIKPVSPAFTDGFFTMSLLGSPYFKGQLIFNDNAFTQAWHFMFSQISFISIISFNIHNQLAKYGRHYESCFTSGKKKEA